MLTPDIAVFQTRRGNVEKLSREDAMVLGGGVLLFIGLLAFPWYSVGGFSFAATDSPYSIWGVLALILTIAVVLDLALARFSPATAIPTTQFGRDWTRAGVVGLVVLFLFIKFIAHVGSFGWGFFFDLVLLAVVAVGAVFTAQGRSSPLSVGTGAGGSH
jgi:hypothetical protein